MLTEMLLRPQLRPQLPVILARMAMLVLLPELPVAVARLPRPAVLPGPQVPVVVKKPVSAARPQLRQPPRT